jgi:basic amino acid/polyamine antiporter, APA family
VENVGVPFSGVDFSHVDAISGDLAHRISLLAILRAERNEFSHILGQKGTLGRPDYLLESLQSLPITLVSAPPCGHAGAALPNTGTTMTTTAARPLQRILGLGFGLALAFGNTIGVGILRLPGTLAGALGDSHLIVLFWILGGLYALLGAFAVAELAAMMPVAGGFYVYARRAFGDRGGFIIGWSDWINNVSALAFQAIAATSFLGALWAPAAAHNVAAALSILSLFTGLHWVGLRLGRALTGTISVSVGLMLLILVVGCFIATPVPALTAAALADSAAALPFMSMAMVAAIVMALRSVLVAFDGWYGPIYVAEESTDPARTLPRAIIGGTLLVAALYLVINIAFIRILPLPVLAASQLPAAAAASILLPRGGAEVVTVISLVTVLSVMNATLIVTPRILVGLSRDGLCTPKAAAVSVSGTPRFALGLSGAAAGVLILTGTFEQIMALCAVAFVFNYISAYTAVFLLRHREPTLQRPYRAVGFPVSTAVVLSGSVLFLAAAVAGDPRSAIIAAALLIASAPAYEFVVRRRRVAPATI